MRWEPGVWRAVRRSIGTASPTPPCSPVGPVASDNAGANTIADHVTVLDQAIARLPAEIAAATARATPRAWSGGLCVRCYSAGCTDFAWDAGARNIGFAVVARSNAQIHAAISKVMVAADCWQPQAWLAVVASPTPWSAGSNSSAWQTPSPPPNPRPSA